MKKLFVILFVVLSMAVMNVGCDGNLWYSQDEEETADFTITFELPGPVVIPWTLTEGQKAVCRQDVWYLYDNGILIDTYEGSI